MSGRSRRHGGLPLMACVSACVLTSVPLFGADTFVPYEAGEVPQSVTDLWKDYDARKEGLEIRVVREWKAEGVVTRYVTFKVGTFKGADARIAAYYSFPDNGTKNPAFVWSHGGGQRAERGRGVYFAGRGFASVDINWNGRPMEKGIDENTDWGRVDATQGPRFYAKALRKRWKNDLAPDEFSIDAVPSPRNVNYFLVSLAGRRAITFLERQPEVDPERIGFAGLSMGGMVTALTSIDPRLKAVAPFVGGTGFRYVDFPGGLGGADHRAKNELHRKTVDAGSYWPLVRCPVIFISSSNDFNAAFERIYQSMALLDHDEWRVTTNMHANHSPGPEQWVLLEMWFGRHLAGRALHIPVLPPSTFHVDGDAARFTVTPEDQERLEDTEIYYSYDPNPRTRFWNRAASRRSGRTWSVDLTVRRKLPLHVFALCRYRLPRVSPTLRGDTSTFTLNSLEHVHMPDEVDRKALKEIEKSRSVFEDFADGLRDWSVRGGTIQTYKFQSPQIDFSAESLGLTIDPGGRALTLRLTAESRFLGPGGPKRNCSAVRRVQGTGAREVLVSTSDFKGEGAQTLEWSGITRFSVSLTDDKAKTRIDLASREGQRILTRIRMVDAP